MNIKELCIRFFNRVFEPYPHELIAEYCKRSEQRIEEFRRIMDKEFPSPKRKHKGHKKIKRTYSSPKRRL